MSLPTCDLNSKIELELGSLLTGAVLLVLGSLGVKFRKKLFEATAYLADAIIFHLTRFIAPAVAWGVSLRQYCKASLDRDNRWMHVPSSLDIKLDIDQAYITLQLEGHDSRSLSDQNLDLIGNRCRIIGDPGSGKSSLIRKFYRNSCRRAIRNPRAAKFPILIELRSLDIPDQTPQSALGNWLFEFIRTSASRTKAYNIAACFDAYVDTSGIIVLLDGLDEVISSKLANVLAAIQGLSEELQHRSDRNSIMLTMRTQFHQQIREVFRQSLGPTLQLKPFSLSDVYDFLRRWPFGKDAESHTAKIIDELSSRPSLREMCGNPLILSMYVADYQSNIRITPPDSRTDFYRKVVDELLIRRRIAQLGAPTAASALKEQRERILGGVALRHLLDVDQPMNVIGMGLIRTEICRIMQCEPEQANEHLYEIVKETGILEIERTNESCRFIHLTFCEFLAALEGVSAAENGWVTLFDAHRSFSLRGGALRSRLCEVIPFACGVLPKTIRHKAISMVYSFNDNEMMARCFLETQQYSHNIWPQYVESMVSELLESDTDATNNIRLRKLHMLAVVMRDAEDCSKYNKAVLPTIALQTILLKMVEDRRASVESLLVSYGAIDAVATLKLAHAARVDLVEQLPQLLVEHCDQAPFLAILRETSTKDTQRACHWASIFAEAALRSNKVARALSEMDPISDWDPIASDIRSGTWCHPRITTKSWLTQCLDICTNNRTDLLQIQRCPAMRSARLDDLTALLPSSIIMRRAGWQMLSVDAAGVMAVLSVVLWVQDPETSFALTSLIVSLTIVPCTMLYFYSLPVVYRGLLRLRSGHTSHRDALVSVIASIANRQELRKLTLQLASELKYSLPGFDLSKPIRSRRPNAVIVEPTPDAPSASHLREQMVAAFEDRLMSAAFHNVSANRSPLEYVIRFTFLWLPVLGAKREALVRFLFSRALRVEVQVGNPHDDVTHQGR